MTNWQSNDSYYKKYLHVLDNKWHLYSMVIILYFIMPTSYPRFLFTGISNFLLASENLAQKGRAAQKLIQT